MVRAEHLSKRFDDVEALRDVTVAAEPGDVIGVLGKNGAGKTTLLEVLLGFSPPTSGQACVFGEQSMTLTGSAKSRIGFVPQRDELIELLTGKQHLEVIRAFHERWDDALTARLIDTWGIAMNRRVQQLSPGERQKLSLLFALGHRPDLLVLDEPVAALDPIARRAFVQQLLDVSVEAGRTVLFSSHIVSDLERAANKVWIMNQGRLIWQGELDALKESVVRVHIRARRGLGARLGIENALSERVRGSQATAAVVNWRPELRAALAERFDADVETESLGLEDIFVELHR